MRSRRNCFALASLRPERPSVSIMISPSAPKSRLRGEVRRHASPIVRAGSGSAKRNSLTRLSRTSTSGRNFRQQRHAIAVRHHLHHGRKRGGAETGRRVATWRPAEGQCLIAQAVSFLQENEPVLIDVLDRDTPIVPAADRRPAARAGMRSSNSRAFPRRRRRPASPTSRCRDRRRQVHRATSWSGSRALPDAARDRRSAAAAARAAEHMAPASE